jgi:hypothetical protein
MGRKWPEKRAELRREIRASVYACIFTSDAGRARGGSNLLLAFDLFKNILLVAIVVAK